jgi:hypothetical protein
MAKKVDPVKAKEKKQKIVAAVGGVILLALVAWQVPKVMKQLHKKPPSAMAATTTTAAPPSGTPSLAAPTLSGSAQPASATTPGSSGSLTSGDVPPPLQEGQLQSFSRFESKDPFAQQLSDDSTSSSSPSSGGSSVPSSSSGGSPTSSGGSQPSPGSAVISVNGTLMSVTVGSDFPPASPSDPTAQPLFHLIALTMHTAKIAIVGGSYSNGAPSITLHENRPLTLMNTADGTRYKLILKPQGTPIPGTSSSSSSGSTSSTPTVTIPTTP